MGVLITGMHRSGTSILAQWVAQTGLGTGDGPLFEVNPANPRGLYEREDVVRFNDRWLGILGGSWWAPPFIKEQTWRSIDGGELDRDRFALDYFRADFSNWYAKDPRLSLLLPLWDRLALQKIPAIVAVRRPRDVAMSLNMRNGLTLRRGLALWLAYNRAIFSHTLGRSFVVLDLARSMERPEQTAENLLSFLQELGLKGSGDPFTITENLEAGLLRQHYDRLEGTSESLARELDDVYEYLRALHGAHQRDVHHTLPMPDWAAETLDELTEFWDMKVRGDILEDKLRRTRNEVQKAHDRLEELHNVPSVRVWRWVKRG